MHAFSLTQSFNRQANASARAPCERSPEDRDAARANWAHLSQAVIVLQMSFAARCDGDARRPLVRTAA